MAEYSVTKAQYRFNLKNRARSARVPFRAPLPTPNPVPTNEPTPFENENEPEAIDEVAEDAQRAQAFAIGTALARRGRRIAMTQASSEQTPDANKAHDTMLRQRRKTIDNPAQKALLAGTEMIVPGILYLLWKYAEIARTTIGTKFSIGGIEVAPLYSVKDKWEGIMVFFGTVTILTAIGAFLFTAFAVVTHPCEFGEIVVPDNMVAQLGLKLSCVIQ